MRSLAFAAFLLAGCNLYFGGGDDEPQPCQFVGEPAFDQQLLRNPDTGECTGFGGGCDTNCGPCAADLIAQPNWGSCFSQCEGLDEKSCIAAPGCQTAYDIRNGQPDATGHGSDYIGCWQTAPAVRDESMTNCASLDSNGCNQSDICAMNYSAIAQPDDGIARKFAFCSAEGGSGTVCYSDMDCPMDERCTAGIEECGGCEDPNGACPAVCSGHCVPRNGGGTCENIDCGQNAHCEEQCVGNMTSMECYPTCVPDNITCANVDCGPGTECVEVCEMTPNGPAQCHPECRPTPNPTACEMLPTEMECAARNDCSPVYEGDDCTCYPWGCECNILLYDHCTTWGGGMTGDPGQP